MNLPVRPTTDMSKEGLFNILSNRLDLREKTVLDLFAGTGAISFEFASRGCKEVVAVDSNFKCIRFIRQTAEMLSFNQLQTLKSDIYRYLKSSVKQFDIIFADPPYAIEKLDELSNVIIDADVLSEQGWLIIEHPATVNFTQLDNFVEHRRYGNVNFSFFNKKAAN